jgi:phosphatidylinositol 4-kinase type 2
MPRPPTSGYARIAQAEEEEEEPYGSDEESPFHDTNTTTLSKDASYAPIQPKRRERMHIPSGSGQSSPGRHSRRKRANSGVDIKAINARLERWADEIKDRFKIRRVKGKSADDEHLEIHHSVFQAPEWIRPFTKEQLEADHSDASERLSKLEFDDMVESVRVAIELGKHPTLIAQGSSGSYFVRNTKGKVLGVFKPKDEEPYASKNPKWTKWIHRNLFPFFFGRACLIPNLSYVSEAAAYVLDCQLRTNIVPYTEVVSLSSKSFFYDFWDRRSFYRKGKPLPEKQGSFQVFLKGYKGATEFFKEHPWPDQHNTNFKVPPKRKRNALWADDCRPKSRPGDSDEEDGMNSREQSRARHEFWSEALQESFREQLEKLVILDYIMRNTDRGTDNWMIRIDSEKQAAEIVARPPKSSERQQNDHLDPSTAEAYNRRQESMTAAPSSGDEDSAMPRLGAIDNSLSWPWKHPDAWRSYPFGWLFLPVTLIGRPFTDKTRRHFLPLLTSKEWWTDTQVKLRNCFELDADFKERMFARQIAVMKGQAWNVVETLKTPDHGPLELTRRQRACVWDDLVDIPVAMPMSRPSEEMRQQAKALRRHSDKEDSGNSAAHEEEMDISAAYASAPAKPQPDLLGAFGEANENPFNSSRQNSSDLIPQIRQPTAEMMGLAQSLDTPASTSLLGAQRPVAMRSNTICPPRMSYDVPSRPRGWNLGKRRSSFSVRRIALGEDDDEDDEEGEGDLGFGAAREREGMRRKVIVERLEMVKSKPPVFTWC